MDTLIGFGLLFLLICVVIAFLSFLVVSFWFRLIVGLITIWVLWVNISPESEPIGWIITAIIGLGILSPWFIVIMIGGAVAGYLIVRR